MRTPLSRLAPSWLALLVLAASSAATAAPQAPSPRAPAKAAPIAAPTRAAYPPWLPGGRAEPEGRREALEHWLRQRAYPTGVIPERAHGEALARFRAMLPQHHPRNKLAWELVGPAPLDTTKGPYPPNPNWSPAAGRVSALAIDPTDPKTLYVGAGSGGLWKSTDGGASFTPLTDALPTSAVGAVALDPQDPKTLWLGTGSSDPYSGYFGQGIYQSTDGGLTWSRPAGEKFAGLSVSRIVLDQAAGAMYAAVIFGYRGNGDACTSVDVTTKGQGLYRSADGGKTWTLLVSGTISDVEVDTSASPRRLYVYDFATKAVRRSDDGGATWADPKGLPSGTDRIELAIAPTQPSVIYAGTGTSTGSTLYISTDHGQNFTQVVGSPNYCERQCFFDNVVTVAPDDPGTVYLGGAVCSVWKGTGVLGASPKFTLVSLPNNDCGAGDANWPNAYVHADVHAIAVDPKDPAKVYVGSDGGLAVTPDRGDSWKRLNTGMATLELYAVCADPADPEVFYGAAQDNGTFARTASSLTWHGVSTGDGSGCAVDPVETSTVLVAAQYSAIFRSTDRFAKDMEYVFDTQQPYCKGMPGCGDRAGFIAPLAGHPTQAGTFYAGTYRLFRSTEGGALGTWKAISGDLTAGKSSEPCVPDGYASMDDYLSAIGVGPGSADVLYTGSAAGKVAVTQDGGATWTKASSSALPPRYVTGIAVDAADSKRVAVAFSGFGANTPKAPGHVFVSTDAGQTWKAGDTGMDAPVNALLAHPTLPGVVYAGMDVGVLVSTDGGATFAPLAATGLPNAPVWALSFRKGTSTLVAGTHGRSAWQLTFQPELSVSPASLTFTASEGAPAAAQKIVVTNGDTLGSAIAPTAKGDAVWLGATPSGIAGGAKQAEVSVSVQDLAAGEYDAVVTISAGATGEIKVPVHVTVKKGTGTTTPSKPGSCGCGIAERGGEREALAVMALLALAARRRARRAS